MSMQHQPILGTNYGFSATRITDLGASELTLVAIAADTSTSVTSFQSEIESCIKQVALSCYRSPRADNLLLRVTGFNGKVREVHGFKPLRACDIDGYHGALKCSGWTALYDAAHNAIESVSAYAEGLSKASFDANGIVFIITDGDDNRSRLKAKALAAAVKKSLKSEALESLLTVLIGVNITDPDISRYLSELKAAAGFDQYIEIDNASADSLAQLANFVTRSISLQSMALGSGGSGTLLRF